MIFGKYKLHTRHNKNFKQILS